MTRTARHGHQVAYNAQTVVDGKHKLVVACELTNDGNDQCQLHVTPVEGAGVATPSSRRLKNPSRL